MSTTISKTASQSMSRAIAHPLTLACAVIAVALALPATSRSQTESSILQYEWDFSDGLQNWNVVFADYPADNAESVGIIAELRELPEQLLQSGDAFYVSGTNISDSLMMMLTRELDESDGIIPGQTYLLDFVIQFASNAQSDCVGIGGAPGESVFLRAGGTSVEPQSRSAPGETVIRLNVNAGNQSQGGPASSSAGNIANGEPCGSENDGYVSLVRSHRHTFPVTANEDGELWLNVLTDSGFEGTTALFYQRIAARLTPVTLNAGNAIANLSSRAIVAPEASVIGGFVIEGEQPLSVLIRGVGPSLAPFGVSDFLDNPRLALFDAKGELVEENDDWAVGDDAAAIEETGAQLGAFPLEATSADAALIADLAPGVYTCLVAGAADSNPGQALLEIYPTSIDDDSSRLVNLSARAHLFSRSDAAVLGFVVAPPSPQRVLLRAVGPGLEAYGVAEPATQPELVLQRDGDAIARSLAWPLGEEADLTVEAAENVGAFPLMENSADAAMIINLQPGLYTLEASDAEAESGTILLEAYQVPLPPSDDE